jgi:hypothetical protein
MITQWGRNNFHLILNKHTVVLDGDFYLTYIDIQRATIILAALLTSMYSPPGDVHCNDRKVGWQRNALTSECILLIHHVSSS